MEHSPIGDSFWEKRRRKDVFDDIRKDNGDILSSPMVAATNDFIDGINGLKDSLEPLAPDYIDDEEDEDGYADQELTIFVPADSLDTLRSAYDTMIRRMAKCAEQIIIVTDDIEDRDVQSAERIDLVTGLFMTASNILADTIASVRRGETSYNYVEEEIREYVAKLYARKSHKKFVPAATKMFSRDFRSEIGFLLEASDREGLD